MNVEQTTQASSAASVTTYRDTRFSDVWNPDTESIVRGMILSAQVRIVESTFDKIISTASQELSAMLIAGLPEVESMKARRTFGLIEDLFPCYSSVLVDLALGLVGALRTTMDPLATMETNLQRALEAMGIHDPDDARRYATRDVLRDRRYRRFFPESEADDAV